MPEGLQATLNARALPAAHRRLHECLRPGLRVLDVGCGTGAITRDIAAAVAPDGQAIGIDASRALIDEARTRGAGLPNLHFEAGDIYRLDRPQRFDIVHAARVLQWLESPVEALRSMASAANAGGLIIVLDYNHEKIEWTPEPPPAMQRFYEAFLSWRAEAGMDNAIADHLEALMKDAGLQAPRAIPHHERTNRSDPDFLQRARLWAEVAATRGRQMVEDGAISEMQRAAAEADYRAWIRDEAESVELYLLSVEARNPCAPDGA
jgi:SAM-dependent methyltransferase